MQHLNTLDSPILSTRRRGFLKACAVSAVGAVLAPVTKLALKSGLEKDTAAYAKNNVIKSKQVFIFQDRAHFDTQFNIASDVEPYRPPQSMASTKDYVNKTDEITFLQRHWFV